MAFQDEQEDKKPDMPEDEEVRRFAEFVKERRDKAGFYINHIKGAGIRLARHSKRGLFRVLFSRIGLIVVFLIVQVYVLVFLVGKLSEYFPNIAFVQMAAMFFIITYIMNSRVGKSSSITWLALMAIAPVFGILLWIIVRLDMGHRGLKRKVEHIYSVTRGFIPQDPEILEEVSEKNPQTAALAHYIGRTGDFPIYRNTMVHYFPYGQDAFAEMLYQLKKAKHCIYLEYFILGEGRMWGEILEILGIKAHEGLDVRVMYDATCDLSNLPVNYPKRVQELGIQCKKFDPMTPFLSTRYNFRDHRKIMVIDGQIAFTGGINLADEYINEVNRYGDWKDTAVMLDGDAVRSFTLMFLQMWQVSEKTPDFREFVENAMMVPKPVRSLGYVMPFSDSPLDDERVGERVFIDILSRAHEYVYIMTPYFIPDDELFGTITFAAERGIDVRLMLPGIPDKKIVYDIARTYFPALLDAGVKILLYEPGFLHAKQWVSDDVRGFIGTINMDYRSLYHHFECGVYMCETEAVSKIRRDFLNCQDKCICVDEAYCRELPFFHKAVGAIAKIVSPLL